MAETRKTEESKEVIEGMRDSLKVLGSHSEAYYETMSDMQVAEAYKRMLGIED